MRSLPLAADLLDAVAAFIRTTPDAEGFHVQVASNALAVADREMRKRRAADRGIVERLSALLEMAGDSETLEAELSRRIAADEMGLNTPGLADHLWATAVAELEIDQPRYPTLKYLRTKG